MHARESIAKCRGTPFSRTYLHHGLAALSPQMWSLWLPLLCCSCCCLHCGHSGGGGGGGGHGCGHCHSCSGSIGKSWKNNWGDWVKIWGWKGLWCVERQWLSELLWCGLCNHLPFSASWAGWCTHTKSCPTSPPPESHVVDYVWSWDLTCKNKITFLIRISFPVWITKITLSKRQLIHRSLPDECIHGVDDRYTPFPSFS